MLCFTPTAPDTISDQRVARAVALGLRVTAPWRRPALGPSSPKRRACPAARKPKPAPPLPPPTTPQKVKLPKGAALRWTPEEDAQLTRAVAENRRAPDKRSQNGIRWCDIKRRAPIEYPLLMRHLSDITGSSKTLAKRWCQYLGPDDQKNKARKWR